MAEPKIIKFCTRVGNINSVQHDDITNKRACLWSRDCFKKHVSISDTARRAGLSATAGLLVCQSMSISFLIEEGL